MGRVLGLCFGQCRPRHCSKSEQAKLFEELLLELDGFR